MELNILFARFILFFVKTSIAILVSKPHRDLPYVILLDEPEVIPLIVIDDQPEEADETKDREVTGGTE